MTHAEKINYMRVACGIVGYSFEEKGLDMLVSIYDKVLERKGDTNLSELIDVQLKVERTHKTWEEMKSKIRK